MAEKSLGYEDTPLLPGGKWTVHDGRRPQPKVIEPGTASTQEQAGRPPADAIVLFDGTDLSQWMTGKGEPAGWEVADGAMRVKPGAGGDIRTRAEFGDCQLHVEWAAPEVVKGDGQGRGNSGVFLMGCYEIQVLDCYQNPTYPDGTTAAIYGQYPPLVNACRPPGQWQTYDIIWEAPHFYEERLVKPAFVTVIHNGVVIHNHQLLHGPTNHRVLADYAPHPPVGPISLQDHGDLVRFRNIWIRELKPYDAQ